MNNYNVIEDLSTGAFGCVKKIQNKYTNKLYAVKIESSIVGILEYEAKIYNMLTGINNIPSVKSYKNDGNNCFLIMDLMDFNLKYFKNKYFSRQIEYEKNCKNIIISLIQTLSQIHNKNIIHRDIKPENICFKNKRVYLIDFGLSKFIDNNKITDKKLTQIIGTPNYVSIRVLNLNEPKFHDDLESLCYIFIYLLLDSKDFETYLEAGPAIIKQQKYIEKYFHSRNEILKIILQHIELCRNNPTHNVNIYQELYNLYN